MTTTWCANSKFWTKPLVSFPFHPSFSKTWTSIANAQFSNNFVNVRAPTCKLALLLLRLDLLRRLPTIFVKKFTRLKNKVFSQFLMLLQQLSTLFQTIEVQELSWDWQVNSTSLWAICLLKTKIWLHLLFWLNISIQHQRMVKISFNLCWGKKKLWNNFCKKNVKLTISKIVSVLTTISTNCLLVH